MRFLSKLLDKLFPSRVFKRRLKELKEKDPFIYK